MKTIIDLHNRVKKVFICIHNLLCAYYYIESRARNLIYPKGVRVNMGASIHLYSSQSCTDMIWTFKNKKLPRNAQVVRVNKNQQILQIRNVVVANVGRYTLTCIKDLIVYKESATLSLSK